MIFHPENHWKLEHKDPQRSMKIQVKIYNTGHETFSGPSQASWVQDEVLVI